MSTPELNSHPDHIFNIPQELINNIIDFNRGDISTLLNCALVSYHFTARCQEHIFRKIKLSAAYEPRIVIRLRDVLSRSPHLAHFIHTLVIEQLWTEPVDGDASSWLYTSQALGAVLMQLSCLRNLTLKGYDMSKLDWSEFPEALQEALGMVMKNGCIRRLVLSFVTGFPLRYIVVPSLTDVELVPSLINAERTPWPSESPVQLSRWRSFCFGGYERLLNIIPFIMSPRSGIDLSDLHKLVIRPVYDGLTKSEDIRADWVVLSQLLQRVSHCVQDIWISPSTCSGGV
ncbi:hypothetical protein BJ165DRAFT_997452 [Panaeolus papilionaceus]|nr:hypothetical protein BJ165DRAFT_997452 [Panaeolus papilionaceus]